MADHGQRKLRCANARRSLRPTTAKSSPMPQGHEGGISSQIVIPGRPPTPGLRRVRSCTSSAVASAKAEPTGGSEGKGIQVFAPRMCLIPGSPSLACFARSPGMTTSVCRAKSYLAADFLTSRSAQSQRHSSCRFVWHTWDRSYSRRKAWSSALHGRSPASPFPRPIWGRPAKGPRRRESDSRR